MTAANNSSVDDWKSPPKLNSEGKKKRNGKLNKN